MPYFSFEILHQSTKSRARVGRIHTPHGIIDTPNFVPVGTNGTMKALDSILVSNLNVQLMFCNTYHLMLQPGSELIKTAGGLHAFMNRQMPLITDSGGFQVFSLMYGGITKELKSNGKKIPSNSVLKITEDGVLFRSYRDGSPVLLTPETSIQAQKNLGADIIIPLDELPPFHISKQKLKNSFDRTHRWEERSLREHLKNPAQQAMYAVIHGGTDPELRKKSCEILRELPFDGFAIGGSLGENHEQMFQALGHTTPEIPYEKPIHLLGIADLKSIIPAVELGIDTMDSSHPTKCARHGLLFTTQGTVKLMNAKYKTLFEPIDPACSCYTCKHYTLAYLRHLFDAHELTAYTLASIHNIHYMISYMEKIRTNIMENKL